MILVLIVCQRLEVDLDVEVAAVGQDRAVVHDFHVVAVEDVHVAGRAAEDVADLGRLQHRHDAEAVHDRLQRLERVDFGDDDVGAHALGAHGNALAAPAVAADDEILARQQDVGGADDAVDGALAGAVAVVEEVLGLASLTAMTGKASLPAAAIARSRMTPVVVSSVPPTTFSSRLLRLVCSMATRSMPSSMVMCGLMSSTLFRWLLYCSVVSPLMA